MICSRLLGHFGGEHGLGLASANLDGGTCGVAIPGKSSGVYKLPLYQVNPWEIARRNARLMLRFCTGDILLHLRLLIRPESTGGALSCDFASEEDIGTDTDMALLISHDKR